jgi:hypothetical protein
MSLGFMKAVELMTCRMPEDPTPPMPVGGFIVACAAFNDRGFNVLSHQFLRSLLQFYGLELHHLTLSGILHIVTFVTLCEACMGIIAHLNMWNYFFCACLMEDSGVEVAVLGGVDIYVTFGHDIDPYFHLPMSEPSDRWWKVRFFLRNDADALLLVFTGRCLITQPNWGYGVASKDLLRLQPLREVIQ